MPFMKELAGFFLRTAIASLIMGICVYASLHLMAPQVDMQRVVGLVTQVSVALAVGLLSYILISLKLNRAELVQFLGAIKQEFKKR
jgi:uncharacterized membrane protein YraQ (UPF0718 family)